MKFTCCVFDFFNFRTLLTWIFCFPIPIWMPTPGSLVGSVGMVSNHLWVFGIREWRDRWRDLWTKVAIGLVTSWDIYNINVVVEPECCGRIVSWHDPETHPQLVSPDLDCQTLVCIIANDGHWWWPLNTKPSQRNGKEDIIIKHDDYTVTVSWTSCQWVNKHLQ